MMIASQAQRVCGVVACRFSSTGFAFFDPRREPESHWQHIFNGGAEEIAGIGFRDEFGDKKELEIPFGILTSV
jgi:hypothetical protein